ncbi:TraB/VirB10 family protein [Desulforhopalus sp. IMCC35007]|uniref:TraB/VirB10 family protein n=1 Tax=Desulforhopalus sp. IMCC35007 TaxID=2569543 RepID=UPI0010AEDDF1|nr:TraB/VirB10 family protein [Desulforhopalus sp. IMCC35007]TKB11256.1 conjugal transfer protein TraB [Desulforhopalus sp. IMCC35007]
MSLKKRFNDLEPKMKKIVIWSCIGIIFLVLVSTGYNSSRTDPSEGFFNPKKTREIQLEPDLIQKTMLREQRRQLESLQDTVDKMKQEQKKTGQENNEPTLPVIPTADQIAEQNQFPMPSPEEQPWPLPQERTVPTNLPQHPKPEPRMIGEISVLSNPAAATGELDPKNIKKKGRTVYLPPSFMEAKLLTGFDASTSGKGTSNPEPLLLRIQTPAVLPNDIKANLAGCFVIAEAVGRLDKERADVRLVSLSCLSNEGKAIIDTPVKGFVTDSDSKVGLSGRVVSRMGATTARTILAGFFSGMGDMLKSAATTQSTSVLGTTTTIDSSQVAKYAIGGGMSEGAASLHDFYLSLAKQATPVIEVGAAKEITVIVSEGKELEIREFEGDTL